MKYLFTLALTMLTLVSFSQSKQFKVFGTIVSDEDQTPLESATVYLERAKDSTMVTYAISDRNGAFSLENRTRSEERRVGKECRSRLSPEQGTEKGDERRQ